MCIYYIYPNMSLYKIKQLKKLDDFSPDISLLIPVLEYFFFLHIMIHLFFKEAKLFILSNRK
jgi:hypothetical protein